MYYVYILSNKPHGTLYIGVTNNLTKRVYQHKTVQHDGFTKKYHLHRLVYHEETNSVLAALTREKQLKNWRRAWKITLIESVNPNWEDLFCTLV